MIRQSLKDLYFSAARSLSLPNTYASRVKYRVTKPKRPEGHYVHLGCGWKYLDGMINVDGYLLHKIDLWLDLRNGLPFPDRSCRFVYSSHVIEHMYPYEAIRLLREVRRVLADDGVARIAVPSMEYALKVARGEAVDDWPRAFGDPTAQALNYLFCDGQHKFGYSFGVLDQFAREAGFGRVGNYSEAHGVRTKTYGAVTVGDEPVGSLVVELAA